MQVNARDGEIRAPGGDANLGQGAFVGQGVADERVSTLVDRQRVEATKAVARKEPTRNGGTAPAQGSPIGETIRDAYVVVAQCGAPLDASFP